MTQEQADGWMPRRPSDASSTIVLPGYRDFVLIARNDASEVYRAQQDGVERPVAVKVLLLDDAEAIARFERELDITVTLGRSHPHIVTVIDTGLTGSGRPCIVMEFYDLGSLHDRLRAKGPLPWGEVLAVATVVADALSFAHGHGVLHRDIKPQNILRLPTSYVLADFGIARPVDAGHTSSVDWFSFRHASPQAIDGETPTVADDIWSLGSTLYTLLDGRSPFAGEDDSPLAYMKRIRTDRPRPLTRPDVPPGLVAIIDRCLAFQRADRFPSAEALHEALTAIASESRSWAPLPSRKSPPSPPPARKSARHAGLGALPDDKSRRLAEEQTGATVAGVMSPAAMAGLVSSVVATGYDADDDPADFTSTGPRRRSGRSLRRLALLAIGAVVVGGVLGLGTTVVATLAADRPPPGPTPSASSAAPSPSDSNDPRIAPTDIRVERTATGAMVRWSDPSGGRAEFIVVRVIGDKGTPVRTVNAGVTELAVSREELGPPGPPYCFLVIAVANRDDRGVSATRCG